MNEACTKLCLSETVYSAVRVRKDDIDNLGCRLLSSLDWEMLVYNRTSRKKKEKRRVSWRFRSEPRLLLHKLGKLRDQYERTSELVNL